MEQPTGKSTRTEEQRALLEKWEGRLYPVFLQMGLDFREFWRRWENDGDGDLRECVRDSKLMSEMVTTTMQRAAFDARLDSLESLGD